MQIDMIDFTGAGSSDPLYAARLLAYTKATRLEQGAGTREKFRSMPEAELRKELIAIANTIRSSWEFVDFTFEIKGVTRAYTHQQVRSRVGVSFAQQAQRVVDMSSFEVLKPQSITDHNLDQQWEHFLQLVRLFYSDMSAVGVPAQDRRAILPTNVLTNIIMKINLRAFAELVGKRKNLRAQGEYADVVMECERLVLEQMPWTREFLEPERTATPYLDKMLKETLGNRSPVDVPEVNEALKELDKLKGTWG